MSSCPSSIFYVFGQRTGENGIDIPILEVEHIFVLSAIEWAVNRKYLWQRRIGRSNDEAIEADEIYKLDTAPFLFPFSFNCSIQSHLHRLNFTTLYSQLSI